MTRTLVVTNDFPPRRGGIENFVFSLCEAMPVDDVVVYTARMDGSDQVDDALGFPVVRDSARVLLPTWRVARQVASVARARDCDAVVFGAAAPLGLLARGLRRRTAVRSFTAITHGHEVWWARVPAARQALRRIGDDADVVTYVSEFCRDRIAPALSPAGRARMQRLSPMVDTSRFHPAVDGTAWRRRLGLAGDAKVVLSASRLVRRKGQDVVIRAWPDVVAAEPRAQLVIVGDGPSRPRLGRLARASGVDYTITFVPGMSWDQMPAVYAMADVLALPCRTRLWGLEPEAFGIVFLEAAASGLSLVVGSSGGAPEAAQRTEAEVLEVDPRDERSVAQALLTLLAGRAAGARDPARLEQVRRRASGG